MVNQAIVKRSGPFIQFSVDGERPLPAAVVEALEEPLYYTHLSFEWAQMRFGSGRENSINAETRRLFQYDEQGLLVTQHGFLSKLRNVLTTQGYTCEVIDCNEPKAANIYESDWDSVFEKFNFRPQQDVCLSQIDMHDGGIIDAITAFGKMYILAMVCALYRNAKIDIVVSRKDVAESICRLVTKYVSDVGRVGGGKKKKGRVTVYTAKSLHHSDFDADIVLADEVHELVTDANAAQISRYHNARMFGFTASKETRMDNAHHRLEGLFGPTIFKIDYQTGESLGLVVPMTVQWLDVQTTVNPCKGVSNITQQKRWGIWRHDKRNQIIAEMANAYFKENKQVLILVDTVDHLLHLRKYLPEFSICCGENARVNADDRLKQTYVREGLMEPDEILMDVHRREQTRKDFESREILGVIATGVWAVGVSFDGLNVLMRADGADSETANIQLPGRVCRTDTQTGKACGILVDCMDYWDRKFKDRSYNRRRSYGTRGWTQVKSDGSIWNPVSRSGRAKI